MLSWLSNVDYILYPTPDSLGNIGHCCHCQKKSKNISYLIYQHQKHCVAKASNHKKQQTIEKSLDLSRKRNSQNTDKKEEKLKKIARFICENSISINVTQTQSFRDLVGYTFSECEIRKCILDMADEIKESTKKHIKYKLLSIVIDGATIIGTPGWYAVGLSTENKIFLYDVYHFSNSTTFTITENLIKIINDIENSCKCQIIGASSDNAKNIANVFDTKHKHGLAVVHKKFLIRSPCQAHTSNLVCRDLQKNNEEISKLFGLIRAYALDVRQKNVYSLFDINLNCPLVRDTQWHTEYSALEWLVKNKDKLNQGYNNIPNSMPWDECPIDDDWILLERALRPLANFCRAVEADVCPLYEAYEHYTALQNDLNMMKSENRFAEKVLTEVHKRWMSTADIQLMKLAHSVGYDSVYVLRNELKELTKVTSVQRVTGTPEQQRIKELIEEFDCITNGVITYATSLGLDLNERFAEVNFVLKYVEPLVRHREHNSWQSAYSNPLSYFDNTAKQYHLNIDCKIAREVCFFIAALRSLPSSEAYCERVFAKMRRLFPNYREKCKDDLVRAQTVVKLNQLWHNQFEFF